MKNGLFHLGKFVVGALEVPVIPTTIGRYQPPHNGHLQVFENLRQKSSILQNMDSSLSHLPPALIMIGSSGENRNLQKNPLSLEQRFQMIRNIAPWLPEDSVRNNPAILPYVGTYNNISPPSLEGMAEQLKSHCAKHNIPLEYLAPLIMIKSNDRQDFQIYGKTYKNTHQMSVVAQGLGLPFYEKDAVDSGEVIHATNIRKNLSATFHFLHPKNLQYLQEQLMLASLNSRDIGVENQSGDRYIDVQEALRDLVKRGKMMSFDITKAQIVDVPPERRDLFLKYMGSDYVCATAAVTGFESRDAKKISDHLNQKFTQVIISEGQIVKEAVCDGKNSVVIVDGVQQMEIVPHIVRDNLAPLSDSEKEFLGKANKNKDAAFARDLKLAIDIKEIDVNAKNSAGKTLLELSVANGLIYTTKMLLENGVDFPIMVRGPQNSPLHKMAMGAQVSFVDTYPDCFELGNILVEHSYKISVSGKVINPPMVGIGDDFEARKKELLNRNIFASNMVPTDAEKRKEFCERIIDGAEVKKSSAVFLTVTEDGKESHFLKKSKCVGVETKYGSDLFRILSKKHYEAKRELLQLEANNKISALIKFDPHLSADSFLNRAAKSVPNFDVTLPENGEFLKGYSRMCGVMHVLGEPDRNLENFLVNEKTGKPIKIDNGFLVNYQKYPFGDIYESGGMAQSRNVDYPLENVAYDVKSQDRFKIYGSAQSYDFLVCILAEETYQNRQAWIDQAKVDFGQNETAQNLTKLAESYVSAYNSGLDEKLFEKIKENISKPKNKHLKAAFMSFMSGINDAVNLAKDDKFLNDYTNKYEAEGGENVGILAKQAQRFFQENASQAQGQFGALLEYFNKLKIKPEYAVYNESPPPLNVDIKVANVQKLSDAKLRSKHEK